jgi:hypothetical protein
MHDGLSLRDLWTPIEESLQRRDLEAHLAALVMRSQRTVATPTDDPLALLRDGFDRRSISDVANAHHVATIGFRLVLGYHVDVPPSFTEMLQKELAREPLPPAACVRDDERLLLGVASGIGRVDRSRADDVSLLVRQRERDVGFRQGVLDSWAESLAHGYVLFNEVTAARAYARLADVLRGANTLRADDLSIAFWLAEALLDSNWAPSDEQLRTIHDAQHVLRAGVATAVARGDIVSAVDAAFAYEAFVSSPVDSFSRRSAVEQALAVAEAFPASAGVLANRQRDRDPFAIRDEYDVQDLFHALILPSIGDVVPEDPAPKIAGRSSRLDFVSKKARLGFELKHLKSRTDRDRVREEVLLDEGVYQAHPYIETVVVFIFDPLRCIALSERASFEADLTRVVVIGGRTIQYIVRVR